MLHCALQRHPGNLFWPTKEHMENKKSKYEKSTSKIKAVQIIAYQNIKRNIAIDICIGR